MGEVIVKDFLQIENPRPPVHQRQHDDAEAVLHLGMLIQLIQNDIGVGVPAQLHDDAHPAAIRFIPERRDAFDGLVPHQFRDLFHQAGFVHLIRELGDDDLRLAAGHRFDVGLRPHGYDAPARPIGAAHALQP